MTLANPFQRPENRTLPKPPRSSAKDWAKVYALFVVLILIVIGMVSMKKYLDELQAQADKKKPAADLQPRDPDAPPDNPRAMELIRLAAPVPDGAEPVDRAATYFTELQAFLAEREIADLADRRITVRMLQEDPDGWRGRVVQVSGTLETAAELPASGAAPALIEAVVNVERYGPVRVWVPRLPDFGRDSPTVMLEGVFLRVTLSPDPNALGEPLLLSKSLRLAPGAALPAAPSAPSGPVDETRLRELAAAFRDGPDPVIKESDEFIAVIKALHDAPSGSLAGFAKEVPALDARAKIGEHRGRVVRFYGQVVTVFTERLEATVPQNIEHVYALHLVSYPGNVPVHVYMTRWPENLKLKKIATRENIPLYRDWIEFDAVLLRTYTYEGKKASREDPAGPRLTALVAFARDASLAVEPKMPDPRGPFIAIVLGGAVVLGGAILIIGFLSRKYSRRPIRSHVAEARRDRIRSMLPGPSAGSDLLQEEGPERPKESQPAVAGPEPPKSDSEPPPS